MAVGVGSASAATPEEINTAIDRGKAYLYSHQAHGNWEAAPSAHTSMLHPNDPSGLQFGGMTALATFALLACGDAPQSNDQLKQAVDWLEQADIRGTYAVGLRCQVWNLLPQDAVVKKMRQHDKATLLAGIRAKGEAAGFFGYGEGVDIRQYDHSVSQFAVLGLWSLEQAGEELDTRYWKLFDSSWRSHHFHDGAWGYQAKTFPDQNNQTGQGGELLSMTAAGVATLFITQDYANLAAKCEGNLRDPDIDAGMKWIGAHLDSIDANEWSQVWEYYTLFGICRIGLASGYKEIGTTDWFRWGSDRLMKEENKTTGAWGTGVMMSFGAGTLPVDQGTYNSSFALLFLSRGRAPVVFNKLQYEVLSSPKKSVEANWNQRPRDIANLTRFLGKQTETQLNWQIVNLREKTTDLIDAPILYLAGNQTLKLKPEDIAKLRDYVNEGGIILGHADCGNPVFSESFKKLGHTLFPTENFRPLPADHPIYRNENFVVRTNSPATHVDALDNGARIQMLLIPTGDPARQWQTQSFVNIKTDPVSQLMLNIYLYAVDKRGLRNKGDTFVVSRDESITADHTEKVARLTYDGNWNPEPGGWVRLSNLVHNRRQLDLHVQPIELGKGLLTADYQLADLTGTAAFTFSDAQRQEIKKFVDGGGTLLVDSAGGKSAFTAAAEAELTKMFTTPATVLPSTSAVYAVGDPITEVSYRSFARSVIGGIRTPRLKGLEQNKRIAVFFSPEDLAVGLVGQPVDGIIGYEPASAAHLVENIVLYSSGILPKPVLATEPATRSSTRPTTR